MHIEMADGGGTVERKTLKRLNWGRKWSFEISVPEPDKHDKRQRAQAHPKMPPEQNKPPEKTTIGQDAGNLPGNTRDLAQRTPTREKPRQRQESTLTTLRADKDAENNRMPHAQVRHGTNTPRD